MDPGRQRVRQWLRPIVIVESCEISPGIGSVLIKESELYDAGFEHQFRKYSKNQETGQTRMWKRFAKSMEAYDWKERQRKEKSLNEEGVPLKTEKRLSDDHKGEIAEVTQNAREKR